MADVEHELVLRGIEHEVEGYAGLNESQIRTDMSAMFAYAVEHSLTGFVGYNAESFQIKLFQVGWRLDVFDIHDKCV